MKRLRFFAAAALLVATLGAAPTYAQSNTGNGNNNSGANTSSGSCANTAGSGTVTGATQTNRGNGSCDVLVGVIDALINANALNNVDASALNQAGVQVVCLNDVLNGNDINILSDVLSGDAILNHSLNDLATNALRNANVQILNNSQVVAVNLGSGPTIYLLH